MRLSSVAGDYTSTGTIVDREPIVALGGETVLPLIFIEGSEEVYINGSRKFPGPAYDYTTGVNEIILATPLTAGDKVLLVGRSSTNDIPFTKSSGESVVLANGQTEVIFSSITTKGIEVFVSGLLVDRGRLTSPADYELKPNTSDTITLKHTFPAGTVLDGIQSSRLSWVDPDNLVVNDGTNSKSLSSRFRDTKESYVSWVEDTGRQKQSLVLGLLLTKWKQNSSGILEANPLGFHGVLNLNGVLWAPADNWTGDYTVISWTQTGNSLVVNGALLPSGASTLLQYTRLTANFANVMGLPALSSAPVGVTNGSTLAMSDGTVSGTFGAAGEGLYRLSSAGSWVFVG